jgi:xyloglucan-specific exo-beta-1,4-glucanase
MRAKHGRRSRPSLTRGPLHEPSSGPSDTYDNDPIGVVWVTFDPRTTVNIGHMKVSQNVYVGVADPANSLWHSTDGGQTWSPVAGEPTGVMPHHGKLTSTGLLYLSYNNNGCPYDGSTGAVWKYDTGSGTWTNITPPSSPLNGGYGFGGLSLDALNPNTIVVAALKQWWPDTQFFRNLDGGQTWNLIWNVSFTNPAGWPPYVVPNYVINYASVAPWLTFGATAATGTQAGPSNGLCPQPTPKLGWMVESLEVIFPGYLQVITKEIPKCKRLEFVVYTCHCNMHMMCVWPGFRFMEVRTTRVVLVMDMHAAKHGGWRDVTIKKV